MTATFNRPAPIFARPAPGERAPLPDVRLHRQGERFHVYAGDSLDVLRTFGDATFDAIVTDPPYGLEFMGKDWDRPWAVTPNASTGFAGRDELTLPSHRDSRNANCRACGGRQRGKKRCVCDTPQWDRHPRQDMAAFQAWCEAWAAECLRVLKPGGHLLAFGGARTWHRLATGIEDAGFELRDSIAWLYGQGFPKSMDVSKAIDKAAGATREVVGSKLDRPGYSLAESKGADIYQKGIGGTGDPVREAQITAPATEDASRWEGWGTALKPAFEPIVVARKPLIGTVAANVLTHGTGALNIDACRIGFASDADERESKDKNRHADFGTEPGGNNVYGDYSMVDRVNYDPPGRWPANAVLDEHTATELDEQVGPRAADNHPAKRAGLGYGSTSGGTEGERRPTDAGGPSRFFYCPKAKASERPFYFRPSCDCENPWPIPMPSLARDTDETTGPESSSTSKCGSDTTDDQFLTDTRSTTSTETNSTTTPPTFSPSHPSITSESTQDASCATARGGSPAESVASSSPSSLNIGTSALRVGRSTDDADPATSREWTKESVCGNCGSAARREAHATVKPLALMQWLLRLVTPPDGLVLDPFAGSGTTIEAALREGFGVVGIEREETYLPLIDARIERTLP